MRESSIIAILCSDLHLSLLQPACRADRNWLVVQADYLQQVRNLAKKHAVPVICAGDVFDRWNPPPELIYFALEHLPDKMVCVPGQHDLPNHRIDHMHRSGYGVLVKAGKIVDISGRRHSFGDTLTTYGFGWEQDIKPLTERGAGMHLAVIHRYFWTEDKKYPDAPSTANVAAFKKQLKGYDAAVTGDNHIYFSAYAGDCLVFNCGGFIRRKSDEMDRQPSIGLLLQDGNIQRVKLDTSKDLFHTIAKQEPEVPLNMREFITGLEGLGEHGLNFREAVENHLRSAADVDIETKTIIRQALDNKGD